LTHRLFRPGVGVEGSAALQTIAVDISLADGERERDINEESRRGVSNWTFCGAVARQSGVVGTGEKKDDRKW